MLDDGYEDEAVTKLNRHTPWGPLRGGKYSSYEAGTRVPTIVSWPKAIQSAKVSDALISQLDLLPSLSALVGLQAINTNNADSKNQLNAWLGKDLKGREFLIEQGMTPNAIIYGEWKFIKATKGPSISKFTNIELGNDAQDQLFHLKTDIGEKTNLVEKFPAMKLKLSSMLEKETVLVKKAM